jgi:hypothetical protein
MLEISYTCNASPERENGCGASYRDEIHDNTYEGPRNTGIKHKQTHKRAASRSYTPPITRGTAKKVKEKVKKA